MRLAHFLAILLAAWIISGPQIAQAATAGQSKYQVGDKLPQPKPAKTKDYQDVGWNALIPEGWNPMKAFKKMDLGTMSDADPRAMKFLDKLKEEWDNAPVERGWNGQRIRIPGFVVPLDRLQNQEVIEFLLVPYFGACIHVPPPPANQIIHVFLANPVKMKTMDAVWVVGVLDTSTSEEQLDRMKRMGMGTAGYQMRGERIAPYKER